MRNTIFKDSLDTCSLEEKLNLVEQHFLQTKDEVLQKKYKKMKVEDKILYYENHLNTYNVFCNIIEIPNQKAIKKLNELCKTSQEVEHFVVAFYQPYNIMRSIYDYEVYLTERENKSILIKSEIDKKQDSMIEDIAVTTDIKFYEHTSN